MNEMINKFLFVEVKFIPEMHLILDFLDLFIVLVEYLLKTKKESKKLKKYRRFKVYSSKRTGKCLLST